MQKHEVRGCIEKTGVIAAVRVPSEEHALFAADCIAEGGVVVIEIPLTVPSALQVISQLAGKNPQLVLGAGGVMSAVAAKDAIEAGALFLTCDGFHPPVIEVAVEQSVVVIPGALTPTEVITAWSASADFVKVVPCAQIGGEGYMNSLHRMYPRIPLIASGGVNQQNAANFILAGAIALGVGRELVPSEAILRHQRERISELARRFRGFVKAGRDHLAARARRSGGPE